MAKTKDEAGGVDVLEQGKIYFLYRPRVERHEPEGLDDIANLYMVLSPRGKRSYRLTVIGRERLPEAGASGRQRYWGFVNAVTSDPRELSGELREETYSTKTRGQRTRPAARPAGEGVYQLLRHGDHTHLAYALELPRRPGPVQEELNIADEASYIMTVANPDRPGPPRARLPKEKRPRYPKALDERFRGRRFAEVDPPEFLDHEGTQFILISASDDLKAELGIEIETEDEDESSAEVFRDLRLRRSEHPTDPLLTGEWA